MFFPFSSKHLLCSSILLRACFLTIPASQLHSLPKEMATHGSRFGSDGSELS
jgi:hypothetical protein